MFVCTSRYGYVDARTFDILLTQVALYSQLHLTFYKCIFAVSYTFHSQILVNHLKAEKLKLNVKSDAKRLRSVRFPIIIFC